MFWGVDCDYGNLGIIGSLEFSDEGRTLADGRGIHPLQGPLDLNAEPVCDKVGPDLIGGAGGHLMDERGQFSSGQRAAIGQGGGGVVGEDALPVSASLG